MPEPFAMKRRQVHGLDPWLHNDHEQRLSAAVTRRKAILLLALVLPLMAAGCTWLNLASRLVHDIPTDPPKFDEFTSFVIVDPYDVPGTWYKVQLHVHTTHSLDSSWPVEDVLRVYAEAGYDAVALTDHDAVTKAAADHETLLVIRGEENTVPSPHYPFGPHTVLLGIDSHISAPSVAARFEAVNQLGGLVMLTHPSWDGNLDTGRWELWQAIAAPQFQLVEILNPHSDSNLDEAFWHTLVAYRGPNAATWATAVDDAHGPASVDFGWTMVKAEAKTIPSLLDALRRGSHYPTTGLTAEFGVDGNEIVVTTDSPVNVEFINGAGEVVYKTHGDQARYQPTGAEGFVRIRLYDAATGARAWSQPFWLRGM